MKDGKVKKQNAFAVYILTSTEVSIQFFGVGGWGGIVFTTTKSNKHSKTLKGILLHGTLFRPEQTHLIFRFSC